MHHIAVIRGDGIGPEITAAALEVIEATGVAVRWEHVDIGQSALERWGEPLPDHSLDALRSLGVALKAPLIAPKRTGRIVKKRDGRERTYPSINNAIRRELELFANVRPIRSFPGAGEAPELDIVIVREVSEGIYSGIEYLIGSDVAQAVKVVTRKASERLVRFAFDYARRCGRNRITLGHKANVLNLTDGLLLEVALDVASDQTGIQFDDMMIDALGFALVRRPQDLDVLVVDNQYGDILTDVAAGLVGSLGLAPGANFGARAAVFEAGHGAAPDIAGRGIANPIALILSGAMMLRHIGEGEAAARIEEAVEEVLRDASSLTPDLGGSGTTMGVARAIAERL